MDNRNVIGVFTTPIVELMVCLQQSGHVSVSTYPL
jgi:hypothetical protein